MYCLLYTRLRYGRRYATARASRPEVCLLSFAQLRAGTCECILIFCVLFLRTHVLLKPDIQTMTLQIMLEVGSNAGHVQLRMCSMSGETSSQPDGSTKHRLKKLNGRISSRACTKGCWQAGARASEEAATRTSRRTRGFQVGS